MEQKELNLFLFDATTPASYGLITADVLDDYDYRLDATIEQSGEVIFDLFRNELERGNLDPALFEIDEMKRSPFDGASFQRRQLSYHKSIERAFSRPEEKFLPQG